ncbi:phosphoribosylamine--glycine ligase [Acidovorax sp.]|uniref:phosphoribosylamine--glycine ligase n=1 Tax=Acidovorax sp. TaxID=1872122 RepID=UPI00391DA0E5
MRVLGIGHCNDLAAMYAGMQTRGHDVRAYVRDPASHSVFAGMVKRTDDWQQDLGWVREAGDQGLILFETADQGTVQDALRAEGFQVIGGSALGDRLEADRAYGQQVLRDAGLRTAASHSFASYGQALDFVRSRRQRYVLKFNGAHNPRTRNYIAQTADSRDLAALLDFYCEHEASADTQPDFVLMEHVDGVEIGVGGYFNGQQFLETACIDFEHKRFFAGELGELTGEMGTVVSYAHSSALRVKVLLPLTDVLRDGGYCGYINVNLIANADGLWPLEFTSRFGYPGYAICEALHREPWEAIFRKLLQRPGAQHAGAFRSAVAPGFEAARDFAVGIVLTVPPFPHPHGYAALSKGLPVIPDSSLSPAERAGLSFAEVELRGHTLLTSGTCGYVGVATGCGSSVDSARSRALDLARKVYVPNLRYRSDIGERVSPKVLADLRLWGYL